MSYPQSLDEAVYAFEVEGVLLGREHRTDDVDGSLCWCSPCVERTGFSPDVDGGVLVIHRDIGGTEH